MERRCAAWLHADWWRRRPDPAPGCRSMPARQSRHRRAVKNQPEASLNSVDSCVLISINVQEPVIEEHVTVFRESCDGRWRVRFAQRREGVAVRRAVGVETVLLELINASVCGCTVLPLMTSDFSSSAVLLRRTLSTKPSSRGDYRLCGRRSPRAACCRNVCCAGIVSSPPAACRLAMKILQVNSVPAPSSSNFTLTAA